MPRESPSVRSSLPSGLVGGPRLLRRVRGTHVSRSACSWEAGAVRSGSGGRGGGGGGRGLAEDWAPARDNQLFFSRASPGGGSSGDGGAREPEPSRRPRPSPAAPRPGARGERESPSRGRAGGEDGRGAGLPGPALSARSGAGPGVRAPKPAALLYVAPAEAGAPGEPGQALGGSGR